MIAFEFNAIAQSSAARLIDCLLEGTAVALLAGTIARFGRRQDSRTRFAVWFAALMMVATIPLLRGFTHGIAASATHAELTLPGYLALYLFAAWALIATIALSRVLVGVFRMRALRHRAEAVALDTLHPDLLQTLQRKGTRSVALCVSDEVKVPAALGLYRPAVVIPRWLRHELSVDELNQILLHELAHLRRWDDWTNLAQQIVKAVFFFHPAVWWIEKKISIEREMACDDVVIAETNSPRAYAECLVHLAEKSFAQRSLALAQAALGHVRQTSRRLARILDGHRPQDTPWGWRVALSSTIVFAIACGIGVSRVPNLVSFSDAAGANSTLAAADSAGSEVSNHASMLHAVPASFRTPLHTSLDAQGKTQKSLVVPAKQILKSSAPHATQAVQRKSVKADHSAGLIHLASLRSEPVVSTETVLVVFQGRPSADSDQLVYSVQMWRLTVFHAAADQSANKIPRKI